MYTLFNFFSIADEPEYSNDHQRRQACFHRQPVLTGFVCFPRAEVRKKGKPRDSRVVDPLSGPATSLARASGSKRVAVPVSVLVLMALEPIEALPDELTILGCAIVIGAGIYLLRHQQTKTEIAV